MSECSQTENDAQNEAFERILNKRKHRKSEQRSMEQKKSEQKVIEKHIPYITEGTRRQLPWILIRCVCFLLCFAFLFLGISNVLARKSLLLPWNMSVKVGGFYNEPKDSIDIMLFGSSHMYCSVDPVELQKLTGQSSYILATQEQPIWATYYYIREALKTQKPKIVVLEVNMVTADQDYAEDGPNYSALDPIRFSMNRIRMALATAPWGHKRELLFNIYKYHGRWAELDKDDITQSYKKERDPQRGFVELDNVSPQAITVNPASVKAAAPLLPKVTDYLNRIIDLSKEKGFRLVFFKSPSNPTREEQEKYNAAFQLARERGIPYLDCNQYYREIGIDPKTDFFDGHHLNISGVRKVTPFVAEKLRSIANDGWV